MIYICKSSVIQIAAINDNIHLYIDIYFGLYDCYYKLCQGLFELNVIAYVVDFILQLVYCGWFILLLFVVNKR